MTRQMRPDLFIAQWPAGVLTSDDSVDPRLRCFRRDFIAAHRRDPDPEEVFELEDALRRIGVLPGRHPTHRRLAEPDVARDVSQDHRTQRFRPGLEEVTLAADDRLGHSLDRSLTLVDALDEPCRRGHLRPRERKFLRACAAAFAQDPSVVGSDPKPRKSVVVHPYDELASNFEDADVGHDVAGGFTPEAARRPRIQRKQSIVLVVYLTDADAQGSGDAGVPARREVRQMVLDETHEVRPIRESDPRLDQEALAHVARPGAHRIECLDAGQHSAHFVRRDPEARGDRIDVIVQEATGVEISDEPFANGPTSFVVDLLTELAEKMLGEPRRAGSEPIEPVSVFLVRLGLEADSSKVAPDAPMEM